MSTALDKIVESKLPQGSPSVHLDALRGVAAFSVLLSHMHVALFVNYRDLGNHNILVAIIYFLCSLGRQWVIVFFVMSGYLVGGSVLRSINSGRWSWRSYLLSRLTRLYTVLLPALLLGGLLDWFGMHMAGTGAIYSNHAISRSLFWNVQTSLTLKTLAANGLFLQTIKLPGTRFPVSVFGCNGPLWSLCNEFWYYLAFPLLALLLFQVRSWWKRVACGIGLIAWGWFVGMDIVLLGIPWLMGVLVVCLPPLRLRGFWARGIAIGVALLLVAAGMALSFYVGLNRPIMDSLLGVLVSFLIWVILNCATAPLPFFYIWIARRSAHSSYTLYLTHFPLLIFLTASLHLHRAVPSWHSSLIRAGVLVIIYLYSQLVYELFEKHTDKIRKWIKPYVMHEKAA
jgi:peptidoglycan/LPS O-acetylase OafA/YrhL